MGYEVTRFIDKTNEKFYCSICKLILEDPMQSPCDHLFCKKCINEWLAVNEICTVDFGSLKVDDLKPAAGILCNMLNGLEIKCDFGK